MEVQINSYHSTTWYRRDPRFSPIGIIALVLSIVASYGYEVNVARPIANGTIAAILDASSHNAAVLFGIVASGVAVLLALFSLSLEHAPAPTGLALVLLIVENFLFPMMPIWTLMVSRWGLGVLYGAAWILALVLLFRRMGRTLSSWRRSPSSAPI
jgi:hypothetical protein